MILGKSGERHSRDSIYDTITTCSLVRNNEVNA